MVMVSTRGKDRCSLSDAIMKGLASDGGLFVPEKFPDPVDFVDIAEPEDLREFEKGTFNLLARAVLEPFFEGEEITIDELYHIVQRAFNFCCPNRPAYHNRSLSYLELYHGPTGAFKDFGARFLANCMEAILKKRKENITILVATSGDTGSAVASAFYKKEGIRVKILFPKGGVSERQKKLLTIWGENIESYEVDGTFDDCQRMVKEAFADSDYSKKFNLTSANSINIGRLLPQMTYYVYASVCFHRWHKKRNATIIVPTGNVGNATAALYAKKMGAPIEKVVFAQNANRPIVDYLIDGVYKPRNSVKTYANAMDVGAPSNMERLLNLYKDFDSFKKDTEAYSVSDEEILSTIKSTYEAEQGYIICPHTATAKFIYDKYFKPVNREAVIVSTANGAKFENVIEKAIGIKPELPQELMALLEKDAVYKNIGTSYKELF